MKLSEIRPCDACGGPIAPIFYVMRVSIAAFNAQATNEVLGMHQFFSGKSLQLAEVFAPRDPVKIGSDEFKELETQVFICNKCYVADICIAQLVEIAAKAEEKKKPKEQQPPEKSAEYLDVKLGIKEKP